MANNNILNFIEFLNNQGYATTTLDTYKRYLTLCNNTSLIYFNKPIQNITVQQVANILNYLNTKYSNKTINTIVAMLASYNNYLISMGLLNYTNITSHLYKKVVTNVPKAITQKDMQTLLKMCNNRQQQAALIGLTITGMRISELVATPKANYNFNNLTVLVPAGKNKRQRTAKIIKNYYFNAFMAYFNQKNDILNDKMLFFTPKNSLRWLFDNFNTKNSNGRYYTTHSTRATYATTMMQQGARLDQVARWLGHTSINTTMFYLDSYL